MEGRASLLASLATGIEETHTLRKTKKYKPIQCVLTDSKLLQHFPKASN